MSKIAPMQNHLNNLSYLKSNTQKISTIDNDLARTSNKFKPSKGWTEINAEIVDPKQKAEVKMKKLLYSYCGYAKSAITEVDFFWYKSFLEDIDLLGISKDIFEKQGEYKNLTVSDLTFLFDLNLIYPYLDHSKGILEVIEVGRGYVRLAEICQHSLPG